MNDIELAKRLGRFSLALGTAELLAGRQIAGALCIGSPWLVRICGAREVATGPFWNRVAGDGLDLAGLGVALAGTPATAGPLPGSPSPWSAPPCSTSPAPLPLTRRHGRATAVNTRLRSARPKAA